MSTADDVAIIEFFQSMLRKAHEYLDLQHKETLEFLRDRTICSGAESSINTSGTAEPCKHVSSFMLSSTSTELGFCHGAQVVVMKQSRLKGKTARVMESDWHGLIKVIMDEDDVKGRIKSFQPADLKLADRYVFREGDRVKVIKKTRLEGKFAVVLDPIWNGLVKVRMLEDDTKGNVKTFQVSHLEPVQGEEGTERFRILDFWEDMRSESHPLQQDLRQFDGSDVRRSLMSHHVMQSATLNTRSSWNIVVLHPYGNPRALFDYLGLCFMLWDLAVVPLCFFELPENLFLISMAWACRLYWTCVDIPVSFLSGYVTKEGSLQLDLVMVAKRYLHSWFVFDCVVVIIAWAVWIFDATCVVRLLQLIRVVRMPIKINKLVRRTNNENYLVIADVAKLSVTLMASSHLLACVWYAIAQSRSRMGKPNWVTHFGFDTKPLYVRYTMSLRWALCYFSGGMDEINPINGEEHVYATFVILVLSVFGVLFVSILTASVTNFYLLHSQNHQRLMSLRKYLSQNGISTSLAMIVDRNASNALNEERLGTPELLRKISERLCENIHVEMFGPVFLEHPFFIACFGKCISAVRKVCHTALSQVCEPKDSKIFSFGESPEGPKTFILQKGGWSYAIGINRSFNHFPTITHHFPTMSSMKTTSSRRSPRDSHAVIDCRPGQWVSEASIWMNWVHCGDCRVTRTSYFCVLDTKLFQAAIKQFKHAIGGLCCEYATSFVNFLRVADQKDVNDLISGISHAFCRLQRSPTANSTKSSPISRDCSRERISSAFAFFSWSRPMRVSESHESQSGQAFIGVGKLNSMQSKDMSSEDGSVVENPLRQSSSEASDRLEDFDWNVEPDVVNRLQINGRTGLRPVS